MKIRQRMRKLYNIKVLQIFTKHFENIDVNMLIMSFPHNLHFILSKQLTNIHFSALIMY